MRTNLFRTTAIAMIFPLAISGCANMNDQTKTKAQGTTIGAAGGAAVGAILGAILGDEEGAAIGAGIGALAGAGVGYMWGSSVAAKKREYANHEQYLNDCIAELQKEHAAIASSNAQMRKTVAAKKQELDQLIALRNGNQPTQDQFIALDMNLKKSLKVANADLKRTDGLIQEHDAAMQAETVASAGQKNWTTELASLKAERAQLVASIDAMNVMETTTAQIVAAR